MAALVTADMYPVVVITDILKCGRGVCFVGRRHKGVISAILLTDRSMGLIKEPAVKPPVGPDVLAACA